MHIWGFPYRLPWSQAVKNLPAAQETWAHSLRQEDSLEKAIATHSSIHAQRIPWTQKPGWLQSWGCKELGRAERLALSLPQHRPWDRFCKSLLNLTQECSVLDYYKQTNVPASFPQIWLVKPIENKCIFSYFLGWGYYLGAFSQQPPVNWSLYLQWEKTDTIVFNGTDKIWSTWSSKSSYCNLHS